MAQLQKNNVVYQNVEIPAKTTGAILAHSPYLDENGIPVNDRYTGYIQEPRKQGSLTCLMLKQVPTGSF